MTPQTERIQLEIANCKACTLGAMMKDCKACKFNHALKVNTVSNTPEKKEG